MLAKILNTSVTGLKPSATLAINEHSNKLIASGKKVYKFGLGQSPFPVPDSVVAALQKNAFQKDYLPVKGLPQLREAVAAFHHRKNGLHCTAEDVLIGPGSKELLFLVQLAYDGDLLITNPSWVSYAPQASIIGRRVAWLNTRAKDNWMLTPEVIAQACKADPTRPRILILNYPSNPTGATFTISQLKALAEVARQYKVLILSDEIYGELHHKGQHESIAQFYPEGTIVSSGLSKWCGAGGWRLGTFVFPKSLRWLLDAMASVASETFTATSAPIQYAAITAFEGSPEIDRYLKDSQRILKKIGNTLYTLMHQAHIELPKPEGGFYFFADFKHYKTQLAQRNIFSSKELCSHLLKETGVAMLPGSSFGRPESELTARMAYVDFDGTFALQTVQNEYVHRPLDAAFINKCADKMVEAVGLMIDWLE